GLLPGVERRAGRIELAEQLDETRIVRGLDLIGPADQRRGIVRRGSECRTGQQEHTEAYSPQQHQADLATTTHRYASPSLKAAHHPGPRPPSPEAGVTFSSRVPSSSRGPSSPEPCRASWPAASWPAPSVSASVRQA